eukprot:scaffold1987_cov71-Phaeocystis_antarctica.AAC.1
MWQARPGGHHGMVVWPVPGKLGCVLPALVLWGVSRLTAGEHHGRGERGRCASLWQQGRIVSANNSYRAGEASICSLEERDRSRCHSAPPRRAGVEHWDGACRSTQCCLAVWPRWVESSTRLGGFRSWGDPAGDPTTFDTFENIDRVWCSQKRF